MDYQAYAEEIQEKLQRDDAWKKQYLGYAEALIKNECNIKERRKSFHKVEPLHVYTTIGMAQNNAYSFDMRYLGQSVATITVSKDTANKSATLSTKKMKINNNTWFEYGTPIANEDWHNSIASKDFRRYFKNIFREYLNNATAKPLLPRQKEHMWESRLFSEFEKSKSDFKAILGIQPVSFAGCRFHMKTALKGSSGEKDLSKKGGEIDVFCRQKNGNKLKLSIIEVKDENKRSESLEVTMKQALAYTVFIRELLRSSQDNGSKWLKIWGVNETSIDIHLNRSLEFNAIVAMPYIRKETPDFIGKIVMLGDDKIYLHYLLVKSEGTGTFDPGNPLIVEKSF
jgi:hypothetical protein